MALYKRRIYLINRPFQLKFSFYLALIVLISSAIYPFIIFELYSSVAQSISIDFPQAAQNFHHKKNALIITLVAIQLCFALLFFIIGILLTHKVAGPLYKLQLFLKAAADGADHGKLYFRDGDYFSNIADTYNESMEKIHLQRSDYRNEIREIHSKLEQCNNQEEIKIIAGSLKDIIEKI
jgi:nitrogen fixation/metabolism regulation signal transduction histidine kinase